MPAQSEPEEPDPGSTSPAGVIPALPVRSTDDTDIGWSERPEQDDEERLRAERPPHWDAFR